MQQEERLSPSATEGLNKISLVDKTRAERTSTTKKGNKPMSLLNQEVLPTLVGEREATVASFKEIENKQGGYIETKLKLSDREYTYCIFPSQISYVASSIRRQLGMESLKNLGEVLEAAKENPIKVWFNYNQDLGRMNVAFHQASQQKEEALDI